MYRCPIVKQEQHNNDFFNFNFQIFKYMNNNKLILLFLAVLLYGCKKEESSILLTVFDTPNYSVEFGEKPGEAEVSTFLITKEEGSNIEQNINLHAIKGFTYEKGYEYLLEVKKASNSKNEDFQYSLTKIISKSQTGELEIIVSLHVTTVRVEGELPFDRMVVEEDDETGWQPSSFKIDGFEYEKGFDYLLKVNKTIIRMSPQSGFLNFYLYTLVEIISKTPQNQ